MQPFDLVDQRKKIKNSKVKSKKIKHFDLMNPSLLIRKPEFTGLSANA